MGCTRFVENERGGGAAEGGHLGPGHRIEASGGFIEEQQGDISDGLTGITDHSAGKADPLLHAATELTGIKILRTGEPHGLQSLGHPLADLSFVQATESIQQEANVLAQQAAKAAEGSSALVIGRPMTSCEAPAAIASAGPSTRA